MTGAKGNIDSDHFYVGIDAGSVSLNCIVIGKTGRIVHESPYKRHLGKVDEGVLALILELYDKFGADNIKAVAFTGNHGRAISQALGGFYEFETISQVLGAVHIQPDVRSIISMGGQETSLLQISHDTGSWELEFFEMNGPCASGTGSFIDQQAQRLATSIYASNVDISQNQLDQILEDFITLGLNSESPADVACRCTVFTKSDMIHLQNKGEKLEDIIYGLHVGNARNYISTIVSNRILQGPILFLGGLSLNALQIRAFKTYFPELIVPPHNTSIGALGVALQALELGVENHLVLDGAVVSEQNPNRDLPVTSKLELKETIFPESNAIRKRFLHKKIPVYLGVDIGSTTTKYALISQDHEIVHKNYVHTQGKPVEVTQRLLQGIREEIGDNIHSVGTATTGSGPASADTS